MSLNKYSVVFSGTQGSGKTTLTNAWSKLAGIPYKAVETRKYVPEGISSHKDIINLSVTNPEVAIKFQSDLIQNRFKLFSELMESDQKFTSDRAVIDSYVYYLMHNSMFACEENNLANNGFTQASVGLYDLTVLINPKPIHVEDDSFRISNLFYNRAYADLHKATTLRIYDAIFGNAKTLSSYSHEGELYNNLRSSITMHVAKTQSGYKRGLIILNEPDGMIPTEKRLNLISNAVNAFDQM